MSANILQSGDRVFHPIYGLGVIVGLTSRDLSGQKTDYYGVRLSDGAVLSVPVSRAEALGLRLVANGMKSVVACLRSPAHALSEDDRQRLAELKTNSQAPQPMALAQTVRDLLSRGRTNRLSPAEQKWLSSACERLSAEVAWVDMIDLQQARASIQQEVERFRPDEPLESAGKGRKAKGSR